MYIFIALFNSDVYDLWVIQNAITNKRFVLQKSSLIPTLLSVQTMLVTRMCHILVIYVLNGPISLVLGIMRVLCSHCLIFLHLVVLLNYTNNNTDINSVIGRCLHKVLQASNKQSIIPMSKCWVFGVVLEGCSLSLFFHCKYNVSKISIHH